MEATEDGLSAMRVLGSDTMTGRRKNILSCIALGLISIFLNLSGLPVLALRQSAASRPDQCEMSLSDRDWIDHALGDWRFAEVHELRLQPKPLPPIEIFDGHCQYVSSSNASPPEWKGSTHGATVSLPDGSKIPAGVVSFAAPVAGQTDAGFFVISLPSVWRANDVQSGLGLERLMEGVFLHEMTHTRQFYFVNPTMERLTKVNHLPDDISDDSLQDTFSKNPDYVLDYNQEVDLLYEAASASSDDKARRIAKTALAHIRARRAKWFTGKLAYWTEVDDVFLTMEGLGQWIAYAWLTDPKGANVAPAVALPEVRRKRNHWTQDEGLALFLVIDRLVPSWQDLAFANRPELAESLLARASSSSQ
jgi:hypothetical protein